MTSGPTSAAAAVSTIVTDMPELRKRPAPKETATPAPVAKRSASKARTGTGAGAGAGEKVKKVAGKVKDSTVGADGKKDDDDAKVEDGDAATTATATDVSPVEEKGSGSGATTTTTTKEGVKASPLSSESVGKKINLDGFGGTVKTHSGDDVTLSDLIGKSEKGVVLFTCEFFPCSFPSCLSFLLFLSSSSVVVPSLISS